MNFNKIALVTGLAVGSILFSSAFIAAQAENFTYSSSFGGGNLINPQDIVINNGILYISDAGNANVADSSLVKIAEFESSGTYLGSFGSGDLGNGYNSFPLGLAISNGIIYVADIVNTTPNSPSVISGKIAEFDSSGNYLGSFGSSNLIFPINVVVNNGNIFVANFGGNQVGGSNNSDIVEFDSNGNYLGSFGSGYLSYPTSLVVNNGNFYITDYNNMDVAEFNSNGNYIGEFGSSYLSSPTDIVINNGNFYVTDYNNMDVVEFDHSGTYLGSFGNGYLSGPNGIDFSNGIAYVADYNSNTNTGQIDVFIPVPEPSDILGLGVIAGLGLIGSLKRKLSKK